MRFALLLAVLLALIPASALAQRSSDYVTVDHMRVLSNGNYYYWGEVQNWAFTVGRQWAMTNVRVHYRWMDADRNIVYEADATMASSVPIYPGGAMSFDLIVPSTVHSDFAEYAVFFDWRVVSCADGWAYGLAC